MDIGDLDLDDKWVRIRAKGGAIEYVYWQTATARLLPRLIDGRGAGPLFLADRRPAPAPRPATRRHLPGHRAGSALLPARGVLVQAGRPPRSRPRPTRLVAAPAPSLLPDPPRRQRPHRRRAPGQEPPHLPTHPGPRCQPRPRTGRPRHRRDRPCRTPQTPTDPVIIAVAQTGGLTWFWLKGDGLLEPVEVERPRASSVLPAGGALVSGFPRGSAGPARERMAPHPWQMRGGGGAAQLSDR